MRDTRRRRERPPRADHRCPADRTRPRYASFQKLVGMPGFEPGTSCTPSRRASQAALHPVQELALRQLPVTSLLLTLRLGDRLLFGRGWRHQPQLRLPVSRQHLEDRLQAALHLLQAIAHVIAKNRLDENRTTVLLIAFFLEPPASPR